MARSAKGVKRAGAKSAAARPKRASSSARRKATPVASAPRKTKKAAAKASSRKAAKRAPVARKPARKAAKSRPSPKKKAATKAMPKKKAATKAVPKKKATTKAVPKKKALVSKKAVVAKKPARAEARPAAKGKKPTPAMKRAAARTTRARVAAARARRPGRSAEEIRAREVAKAAKQSEDRQVNFYEKAVQFFNARKFGRALPYLEKAADGPNATLRQRARVYAQICREHTQAKKVRLKTVEEHYNYAIKLINDRRLEEAARHLDRALQLAPKAGYVHYATAVVHALGGDAEAAFGSLKKAIKLDPRNRVLAVNDADLFGVVHHPGIAELLHSVGHSGESS